MTSTYCFLSEGILFEQVSLLNTSFFLLPLANRVASRSAVSVSPPCPSTPYSCPSLLSALLKPEAPPLLWLHAVKVSSVCCATKSHFAQLPHCCGQDAVSPHLLSQMGNDCSVSGTEKHHQLLSMITFPLLGDQQTSPQTGDRRTNHLTHLTAALAGFLSPVFHHGIGPC